MTPSDISTLFEIAEYLEGQVDINSEGGPNRAMVLLDELQELLDREFDRRSGEQVNS